ncbi:MAG TPA: PKD domain-containing protein, partial [Pedobacter sp.]
SRPNVQFHYCSMASDPSNYSYLWTPSSGAIANSTSQNTTAMPPGTMDYYITVTDISGGCSDVDTVHVDVVNINSLTVTPAGPYCVSIGTTDTLQSSVPVGTGTWTGDGITDPVLGIFDPAIAGLGSHQIIYAVNGACGTGADTINILITPAPDATITSVGNQCVSGTPITLTAATSGGTWSGSGITNASAGTFDPTIAGVGYDTITYTVNIPCFSQDTMVIRVTSQLDATITHVGPFCAAPPAIVLSAVDPGGTWSGPGIVNPAGGIFDPSVAGPGLQVVYYTITGLCGNVDTDTIIVLPSPTLSITSDTTEGCEPTTVVFTGINNQPGGTSLWNFGDPLSGANNVSNSPSPLHTYNYNGSFDVTYMYSNTIGCSDTLVMPGYVTIHSQPVALFSATPQPATILNPEIGFIDNSTGLVDSWHWTFGVMNDSSLIQNPSYTYPDTGVYAVELIVKNIHGCADTTSSFVAIDPIFTFYAPTAFSPDENGNNDVFRVYGDGIDASTFQMMIFNRWGETIYTGTKYEEGWNGAKNNTGELVGQDSYVYKISFKDYAGRKHQYIGHVTIVK